MSEPFVSGHYVFEGTVIHERFIPKQHGFAYKLFYLLIDLDKVNELENLSPLWSINKINLVQFKRDDYMGASLDRDLKASVNDVILQQTEENFNGKIFLLSNLRYWGYCFNPVSYYFCFNQSGDLQYIVDEVTNTPWRERHQYVHKVPKPPSQANDKQSHKLVFEFEKSFHVSPFMPMDMHYKTTYKIDNRKIFIHMDLYSNNEQAIHDNELNSMKKTFFATMNLSGKPLTKTVASLLPFRFPFQCSKIIISIYWQALKLWIKRVPFFPHPYR